MNCDTNDIWDKLYASAKSVRGARKVSPFLEAGAVAAAILTKSGNIYTGVCIDTPCSLGMCAERNATANMITNGKSEVKKLVVVMPDGNVGMPCGACRELLMQLGGCSGEIQILTDYPARKTVRLKTLIPSWWAKDKIQS